MIVTDRGRPRKHCHSLLVDKLMTFPLLSQAITPCNRDTRTQGHTAKNSTHPNKTDTETALVLRAIVLRLTTSYVPEVQEADEV